jgi:hypothetical protein
MHAKDLQLLRASIGHNVILCCTDGEVIVAEIYSVSEEDEDIIYDVVSTNRPDASRESSISHALQRGKLRRAGARRSAMSLPVGRRFRIRTGGFNKAHPRAIPCSSRRPRTRSGSADTGRT